jgi:hypothetical protein
MIYRVIALVTLTRALDEHAVARELAGVVARKPTRYRPDDGGVNVTYIWEGIAGEDAALILGCQLRDYLTPRDRFQGAVALGASDDLIEVFF